MKQNILERFISPRFYNGIIVDDRILKAARTRGVPIVGRTPSDELTDRLLTYIRARFSDYPQGPWMISVEEFREALENEEILTPSFLRDGLIENELPVVCSLDGKLYRGFKEIEAHRAHARECGRDGIYANLALGGELIRDYHLYAHPVGLALQALIKNNHGEINLYDVLTQLLSQDSYLLGSHYFFPMA